MLVLHNSTVLVRAYALSLDALFLVCMTAVWISGILKRITILMILLFSRQVDLKTKNRILRTFRVKT